MVDSSSRLFHDDREDDREVEKVDEIGRDFRSKMDDIVGFSSLDDDVEIMDAMEAIFFG